MKRLVLLAVVAGCGSSTPVNAAGNYTDNVTNRTNGCNLANWTVGAQSTGISVVITQQGATATANITGFGAVLALDALLGGHAFTGNVDGNSLDLKLTGTHANTTGNCTYTYNGEIAATLGGDILQGQINYVAAGNGASDCASITGCLSYQDFNGSRPPP